MEAKCVPSIYGKLRRVFPGPPGLECAQHGSIKFTKHS